ncbi:MAG: 3-hydroxyacyl-CoA dehydrogenase family protein [Haloarculaceae archaeon]
MNVAVLGVGGVGPAVARLSAVAGHDVALHAGDVNDVMDAVDAVEADIDDAAAAGELSKRDRDAAVERIEATTGLDAAVGDADVVLDATERDDGGRQALFADVEAVVGAETLLATAATDVAVTAVAAGLRRPGRALGLHFVDPPAAPLVEVVLAEQTTAETRDRAVAFVDDLGRESVVVRDTPGFVASRLTLALSVEAMQLVDERVAGVAAVDRALEVGAEHATGPLRAADEAGLDARLAELESLADRLGDRFAPPPVLREKVRQGDLGRKTGEGFYRWERGEPVGPAEPDPVPDPRSDAPEDPDAGEPGGIGPR